MFNLIVKQFVLYCVLCYECFLEALKVVATTFDNIYIKAKNTTCRNIGIKALIGVIDVKTSHEVLVMVRLYEAHAITVNLCDILFEVVVKFDVCHSYLHLIITLFFLTR